LLVLINIFATYLVYSRFSKTSWIATFQLGDSLITAVKSAMVLFVLIAAPRSFLLTFKCVGFFMLFFWVFLIRTSLLHTGSWLYQWHWWTAWIVGGVFCSILVRDFRVNFLTMCKWNEKGEHQSGQHCYTSREKIKLLLETFYVKAVIKNVLYMYCTIL
jgi:hypothetical protein